MTKDVWWIKVCIVPIRLPYRYLLHQHEALLRIELPK